MSSFVYNKIYVVQFNFLLIIGDNKIIGILNRLTMELLSLFRIYFCLKRATNMIPILATNKVPSHLNLSHNYVDCASERLPFYLNQFRSSFRKKKQNLISHVPDFYYNSTEYLIRAERTNQMRM